MASYFYLMSSLPMLKSDGTAPITYDYFLNSCMGNISEEKFKLLKSLTLDSSDAPLLKEWSEFYGSFHKELTYQRNKKLGNGASQSSFCDGESAKAIAEALSDNNPLNAENTLLDLQFKKIDDLIGIHSYDDFALFGYAIKLRLLERKTVFNKEKGKAELNRLVKKLEDDIAGID